MRTILLCFLMINSIDMIRMREMDHQFPVDKDSGYIDVMPCSTWHRILTSA